MKKVFAKFYNSYIHYSKLKPYKTEYSTMAKLTEEVGEIAEVMAARWGSQTKLRKLSKTSKTIEDALIEEIGDALVILLNLATSCKVTHEDVFRAAEKKLKMRARAYAAKREENDQK